MKDANNWAKKMQRIGRYKEDELKQWHKTTSLRQRIKMTEELLLMPDTAKNRRFDSPIHCALSKSLENKFT